VQVGVLPVSAGCVQVSGIRGLDLMMRSMPCCSKDLGGMNVIQRLGRRCCLLTCVHQTRRKQWICHESADLCPERARLGVGADSRYRDVDGPHHPHRLRGL
jgi:hypothetical protein